MSKNKQKLNTAYGAAAHEDLDSIKVSTLEDDIVGVIVKGYRDHTWHGVNIAVTATSRDTAVRVNACMGLDGELHFDSHSDTRAVRPTNFGGTNG